MRQGGGRSNPPGTKSWAASPSCLLQDQTYYATETWRSPIECETCPNCKQPILRFHYQFRFRIPSLAAVGSPWQYANEEQQQASYGFKSPPFRLCALPHHGTRAQHLCYYVSLLHWPVFTPISIDVPPFNSSSCKWLFILSCKRKRAFILRASLRPRLLWRDSRGSPSPTKSTIIHPIQQD